MAVDTRRFLAACGRGLTDVIENGLALRLGEFANDAIGFGGFDEIGHWDASISIYKCVRKSIPSRQEQRRKHLMIKGSLWGLRLCHSNAENWSAIGSSVPNAP